MPDFDFSNIELSLYEKLVLRVLRFSQSERLFRQETIKELFRLSLIRRVGWTKNGQRKYKISHTGLMYLRYRCKSFLKFLIPVIISVIALLAAYDVVWIKPIHEALRAIAQLLKTIMESFRGS